MQRRDKNSLEYKIETYPLSIVNTQDFQNTMNKNAMDGWALKHIFTTVVKIVTIWEK